MKPEKQRVAIVVALLVVATLVAYSAVGTFEFNNYDDRLYITDNDLVKRGLTWEGIVTVFAEPVASNWHPLTMISHMLDVQLFGLNSGAHHIVNLVFHLASSVLLFWVLFRMTGDLWPSAAVAAAFALHPLHVEPVAWIASRKDVLSGLFAMLTIWAYGRYSEQPGTGRYVLVAGFLAAGLMAKPVLVVIPALLLLLDYWPLARLSFSAQANSRYARKTVPGLILEKVPLLLLCFADGVLTVMAQRTFGAIASVDEFPLSMRIANAIVSYARYLGKTIWPFDLSFAYTYPGMWPLPVVAAVLLLLIVVSLACMATARKHPYVMMGWLWFLISLLPTIGLLQTGGQAIADRYMYLPLIGLAIIAAWGAKALAQNRPNFAKAVPFGATAIVLGCVLVTRIQASHWRTSEALSRHALKLNWNNQTGHQLLGDALSSKGNHAEAVKHYYEALRLWPSNQITHRNLGLALAQLGALQEATNHLWISVQLRPTNYVARFQLATFMNMAGDTAGAIANYEQVLMSVPEDIEARTELGHLYAREKNFEAALRHLNEAERLAPQSAAVQYAHGVVFLKQGNMDEAIQRLRRAVELKPDMARAHRHLAEALAGSGKMAEASHHYREAIRVNPSFPEAMNDLAALCATNSDLKLGNVNEAVDLAARACELTGYQQPVPLTTLAIAYSAAGKMEEGLKAAERAEALATSMQLNEVAARARDFLARLRTTVSSSKEQQGGNTH